MTGKKLLRGVIMITLIFFIVLCGFSQESIIDKSGKTPKWINSAQRGYIIEVGKGSSINEAKDRAIASVKESVVKAVAEQITSTTVNNTQQTNEGNSYRISGSFSSSVQSKTAQMPFITGISESRVDSYYWEKLRERKTGNVFFYYYVKYPFTEWELKGIIMEFDMQQKSVELHLDEMNEKIETSNSLDELAGVYREIKAILPQLEGGNKLKGDLILEKIQSLLNSISIKEIQSFPGSLSYVLVYGNVLLQTSLSPVIKSNCAGNFNTSGSSDSIIINYSYNGCFENKLNKITLNYQIDDISIKQDFPIDITVGKVEFSVTNGFQLDEESGDANQLNSYKLTFEINSKFSSMFNITKISLEIEGGRPIIFNNLNIPFSGKGIYSSSVEGTVPLKRSLYPIKQGDMISGSIFFINSLTNESGVLKFYNEKLSTNF